MKVQGADCNIWEFCLIMGIGFLFSPNKHRENLSTGQHLTLGSSSPYVLLQNSH